MTRTRARQLNWGLKLFDSGLGSICRGEFGKSSKCVYNWIKFGPVFYSKRNVELGKYNASFILMLWNEHLICSCYWNYTVCVAPMEKREILHIFYVLQIELLFALLFGRVGNECCVNYKIMKGLYRHYINLYDLQMNSRANLRATR